MGYMERLKRTMHMGNGNGSAKSPLHFPNAANVPLIGLPFALEAWFVQILITCKCATPKLVFIIGQPGSAGGQCPSCKQLYGLQGIGIDPVTGQPHFQIAMVTTPSDASPGG